MVEAFCFVRFPAGSVGRILASAICALVAPLGCSPVGHCMGLGCSLLIGGGLAAKF